MHNTLAELGIDDLSQRYRNTLIHYDGAVKFVEAFDRDSAGTTIRLSVMEANSKQESVSDQIELRLQLSLIHAQQSEIANRPIWRTWSVAQNARDRDGVRPDNALIADIGELNRRSGVLMADADRLMAQLNPRNAERPRKMIWHRLDPEKLNTERPVAGWYQAGANWLYLYYATVRQWQRGFTTSNTLMDGGAFKPRQSLSLLSDVLTSAFDKKPTRIRMQLPDLQRVMKPGDTFGLTSQMVMQADKQQMMLYYRRRKIGHVAKDKLVLDLPVFMDEVKECLSQATVVDTYGASIASI